ncbi:aldehyde dehydrogenase family protein [Streptomyces iconiensis]|uniref:Aldehyde dehydrogenase family protein n=1 Tax=Streptomyces iconiensis TaxID=1384038 RepID=A0ABT6ZPG5_9ACTN|nr:aldehyde dehydrogenase family protein [Streptomyces iconiensis]MDJ1130556.1 aldehyde dehydrogenase family protein [Streptomyces iconiensis]
MPGVLELDVLGADGPYRAHRRTPVTDVAGRQSAELSLAPGLLVHRALAALRAASAPPADRRAAALREAGRRFAGEVVAGLSVEEYEHRTSRVSGLPITTVRSAVRALALAADLAHRTARDGKPRAATENWKEPLPGGRGAVWIRRGEVLCVNAPGNHPAVHAGWLEALALGYRVAVRPSRREPFTLHRLVSALRASGFRDDEVMLLPTEHAVAQDLVRGADLALVYGGDDAVLRHHGDPRVLTQGPGRSKILLHGGDWQAGLDTVVDSVVAEGGAACVNATAVFVDGDPAPVAEAIAERLSGLRGLPPEDDKARLPVYPTAAARALEAKFAASVGDARPWLGGEGIVEELGDGSAALRPSVVEVPHAYAPQTAVELPYPCVWVAPWSADEGSGPLKNTLVLTAIGCPERLLGQLVAEPSIKNVYMGRHPTHHHFPGVPHDGYLTDFLMRGKGIIQG